MRIEIGHSRKVIIRDLAIFQAKMFIDGLKGVVLFQVSIAAAVIDLLFGGKKRGRFFYKVLELSERFDLWLNLYSAREAAGDRDGLFGASRAGDNTMLGRIEEIVRGKTERPSSAPRRPFADGVRHAG
jgi:hypothetical protein